jgi:hypothetical protein
MEKPSAVNEQLAMSNEQWKMPADGLWLKAKGPCKAAN